MMDSLHIDGVESIDRLSVEKMNVQERREETEKASWKRKLVTVSRGWANWA